MLQFQEYEGAPLWSNVGYKSVKHFVMYPSTPAPIYEDWWNVQQQVYNNSRILPHYIQSIQHLK